jgi:hypothetical protein
MLDFVFLVLVGKSKWLVRLTRIILIDQGHLQMGGVLFGLPFTFFLK